MIVIFSHFTFGVQLKAFRIQRRKLSQDKHLTMLSILSRIFRGITNGIDSDAPNKTCKLNTGFSEGARVNIFTWLDSLGAALQNNKELFFKFCFLVEKIIFSKLVGKCLKIPLVFRDWHCHNLILMQNKYNIWNQKKKLHQTTYILSKNIFCRKDPVG